MASPRRMSSLMSSSSESNISSNMLVMMSVISISVTLSVSGDDRNFIVSDKCHIGNT